MSKRGSNRQKGAPALPGAGRPPQSTVLRVGDGVALRWGAGTLLEVGKVVEIKRGRPRVTVILLGNGEQVWIMAETPKE